MFNKIPVAETIELVCYLLQDMSLGDDDIEEFRDLITLCLEDNICMFNNLVYKFPDGLPMGGPLSSLAADIYIDNIEHRIHHQDFPQSQNINYWKRYVDDIFCIWGGSDQELDFFLEEINLIEPHIQFTIERGDPSLNYIDLPIQLVSQGTSLTPRFEVYRKPTFTGVSIHNSSLHPRQHKMAAIHAAINRIQKLPLDPAAIKKETLRKSLT